MTTMTRIMLAVCFAGLATLTSCGDDDDDSGIDAAVTIDAASFDANPGAPVASFTMDPTCTSMPNDPITFTSTSTDPDGDPLSCSWTFASATPSSSTDCVVNGVIFPHAAPYLVTLTVDDGNGGVDTAMMTIAMCP